MIVELRTYDVGSFGAVSIETLPMDDAYAEGKRREAAGFVTIILPVGAVARATDGRVA